MGWLAVGSGLAWCVITVLALLLRSRAYAMFRGVQLGLHTIIAVAPAFAPLGPVFGYLLALVYL